MNLKSACKSLLLAALLAGCDHKDLSVNDAWIREAPPGAPALAGYFTLKNGADHDQVLTDASSPAFGVAMLHRTVIHNEVARMEHENTVTVPAHGSIEFAPGGRHLMLMNPKHPLKAGDSVEVTFNLKDGKTLPVKFEVRKVE